MKILVTGATGFIGKQVCDKLQSNHHEVIALTRNPQKAHSILGLKATNLKWDGRTSEGWAQNVNGIDAIINLAGESLVSGRWTKKQKEKILQSRINAGQAIVEAVKLVNKKPEILIQASAVGYYGSRVDEILTEDTSAGKSFLAEVVQQWEKSTEEVETLGSRRVVMRIGLVLHHSGGFLSRQQRQFRMFLGGPLGNGRQWFSWVHMDDLLSAIEFFLEKRATQGIFNVSSPQSLTMTEFCCVLGQVMKRPSWLHVPRFMLRLVFGEMADEALLASQRASCTRLQDAGFKFKFPTARAALEDLLK